MRYGFLLIGSFESSAPSPTTLPQAGRGSSARSPFEPNSRLLRALLILLHVRKNELRMALAVVAQRISAWRVNAESRKAAIVAMAGPRVLEGDLLAPGARSFPRLRVEGNVAG